MAMVDFHSHVLPQVDDGSQSVEESVSLLRMLSEQGVDLVAATPHFYAERQTPERFLENRSAAYARLCPALTAELPEIRLGAEVFYYPGISRTEGIRRLLLEGTDLLLLEMPMAEWSRQTVQEVLGLNCSGALTVVLAHIERYLAFQKSDVWELLAQNGVLLQVNASFFLSRRTRGKALRMLRRGRIHWIGSDCHDPDVRPPRLGQAAEVIWKKLGGDFLSEFDAQNRSFWK